MEYFVIGDEDTVLGFSLAGIEGKAVNDRKEAEEVLSDIINKKNIGIIIITERISNLIREKIEHYTYTLNFPLIVEIPDRKGPLEDRPGINDIIKSAVGINL